MKLPELSLCDEGKQHNDRVNAANQRTLRRTKQVEKHPDASGPASRFVMRRSGHELLIAVVDNPSDQKDLAHHWEAVVMPPGVSPIR